ncbi:MAG: DUF2752 domain-containing protein, partial [Nitriliruptoraceae bacterium]|nr:DUF2752 domain-containing protein [Nitriliruptoraceae bacterium]
VAAPAAVAGVVALAAGTLARVSAGEARFWPGCVVHQLTGLDCPGCGGTRAVLALARGDVLAAVSHNLVSVSLLPVLVLVWVQWVQVTLGRRTTVWRPGPTASWTLAIAIIGFTLVRNLDVPVGRWLAAGAL